MSLIFDNVAAPTATLFSTGGASPRGVQLAAPFIVGAVDPQGYGCGNARGRRCGLICKGRPVAGVNDKRDCFGTVERLVQYRVAAGLAALESEALAKECPDDPTWRPSLSEQLRAMQGAALAAGAYTVANLETVVAMLREVSHAAKYAASMRDIMEAEVFYMSEAETARDSREARMAQDAFNAKVAAARGEPVPSATVFNGEVIDLHEPRSKADTMKHAAAYRIECDRLNEQKTRLTMARKAYKAELLQQMYASEANGHAARLEQEATLSQWRKERRRPITKNANGAKRSNRYA